jgi:hypothetical protein
MLEDSRKPMAARLLQNFGSGNVFDDKEGSLLNDMSVAERVMSRAERIYSAYASPTDSIAPSRPGGKLNRAQSMDEGSLVGSQSRSLTSAPSVKFGNLFASNGIGLNSRVSSRAVSRKPSIHSDEMRQMARISQIDHSARTSGILTAVGNLSPGIGISSERLSSHNHTSSLNDQQKSLFERLNDPDLSRIGTGNYSSYKEELDPIMFKSSSFVIEKKSMDGDRLQEKKLTLSGCSRIPSAMSLTNFEPECDTDPYLNFKTS